MTSPRKILGLDEGATKDEARAAWRKHVRDLHPDRHDGDPEKAGLLVRMNAAWDEIKTEGDMHSRASKATFNWSPDEAAASAIKQAAISHLIQEGFGRLSLTEEELPGIHLVEKISIDANCLYLHTGSAAATGRNILYMPDLQIPSSDPGDFKILPRKITDLSFDAPAGAATRSCEIGSLKAGTEDHIRVIVLLDPDGGTWQDGFATSLRLAGGLKEILLAGVSRPRKKTLREKVSGLFGF